MPKSRVRLVHNLSIYVYGLSPYINFTHMNWVATLDGQEQHESFSTDAGGHFNVLMYSKSNLDNTSHTLIIGPSDVNQFLGPVKLHQRRVRKIPKIRPQKA
jgi:hypothetical protein